MVAVEGVGPPNHGLDFLGQERGDPFIGVQAQDPGADGLFDRAVFLAPESLPFFLVNPGPALPGDGGRVVRAEPVEHDRLSGPPHARKAVPDVRGFVPGDDDRRYARFHDAFSSRRQTAGAARSSSPYVVAGGGGSASLDSTASRTCRTPMDSMHRHSRQRFLL